MTKAKLNITLDEDLKERLSLVAKERRMTISALITEYALSLKPTQLKGQQSLFKDVKKSSKK